MRDPAQDAADMAERREKMLDTAFRLFTTKNIESVTMAEIAKESGFGNKTLHRYFNDKTALIVAVSIREWEKYLAKDRPVTRKGESGTPTAAERFEYYLDTYIDLYENHRDLLVFNQYFNIYVKGNDSDPTEMMPYEKMVETIEGRFHKLYEQGREDKTIRTDIPERKIFAATLHLMMAAITRYAMGLAFLPEGEEGAHTELLMLKEMLKDRYVVKDQRAEQREEK